MLQVIEFIKSLATFDGNATENTHLEFLSVCGQTLLEVHKMKNDLYLVELYHNERHTTHEYTTAKDTAREVEKLFKIYMFASCKKITIITVN